MISAANAVLSIEGMEKEADYVMQF